MEKNKTGIRCLTFACPYCEHINDWICYTPDAIPSETTCEHCGQLFNIPDDLTGYEEEIARDSKTLEDLVASFGLGSSASIVVSQLAIAIEETLIVYHEPHFIRWACRALQGIVDKNFSPIEYMSDEETCTWAGRAATECVSASRQPVSKFMIEDAATAIECALRAQDVMERDTKS